MRYLLFRIARHAVEEPTGNRCNRVMALCLSSVLLERVLTDENYPEHEDLHFIPNVAIGQRNTSFHSFQ